MDELGLQFGGYRSPVPYSGAVRNVFRAAPLTWNAGRTREFFNIRQVMRRQAIADAEGHKRALFRDQQVPGGF